jgi:hypothetical protein
MERAVVLLVGQSIIISISVTEITLSVAVRVELIRIWDKGAVVAGISERVRTVSVRVLLIGIRDERTVILDMGERHGKDGCQKGCE